MAYGPTWATHQRELNLQKRLKLRLRSRSRKRKIRLSLSNLGLWKIIAAGIGRLAVAKVEKLILSPLELNQQKRLRLMSRSRKRKIRPVKSSLGLKKITAAGTGRLAVARVQ